MADGSTREIALRYAGRCYRCGIELAVGTRAVWSRVNRTITCIECEGLTEVQQKTGPPSTSEAGGSAQRRFDQLHGARESRLREKGRLGALVLKLSRDPQSTRAWARGAEGERIVGKRLDEIASDTLIPLHDRRVPGSRTNIDHIVVVASGVHLVDAKLYKGMIKTRDKGGWFRSDERLYVGSRDRTALVTKLAKQILVVDAAVRDLRLPTTLTPVLCFVHAEWSLLSNGFDLQGVKIVWPNRLVELLRRPGPLTTEQIQEAAPRLVERLPPA
jgi:hypothetical protein